MVGTMPESYTTTANLVRNVNNEHSLPLETGGTSRQTLHSIKRSTNFSSPGKSFGKSLREAKKDFLIELDSHHHEEDGVKVTERCVLINRFIHESFIRKLYLESPVVNHDINDVTQKMPLLIAPRGFLCQPDQ